MPKKSKQPSLPGLGQNTTPQQLGSIVKSRTRQDAQGQRASGDTDRLPQLTWIMFLKFLDDMERSARARLPWPASGSSPPSSRPTAGAIGLAASPDGMTGDDLIAFINNDEAMRPDGKRGPGLFAYLEDCRARTAATGGM